MSTRRFLLNPSGTAGDAHPYLAVGQELKRRGHDVYVLTHTLFADLIQAHGLNWVQIGEPIDFAQIRSDPKIHRSHHSWQAAMRWAATGTMRDVFQAIDGLHRPGETTLVAPVWSLGARIGRDVFKLPLANCILNPFILRSTLQSPMTPSMYMPDGMPRWMKHAQYWVGDTFFVEPLIGKEIRSFLQEVGLPSVRRYMNGWWFSPDLVMGLFYENLVPRQADWPCDLHYVGHTLWDPPGDLSVQREVQAFLDADEPPICFVPGSVGPGACDYYQVASQAIESLGMRGLILDRADPTLTASLPAFMHHASYAPLGEVLGKCRAIVHSGCMGTLAQGLAAGIPQLVRPRVNDQPDNARRLERLGVAKSLGPTKWNTASLTRALKSLIESQEITHRCRETQAYVHALPPAAMTIANHLERLKFTTA